MVVQRAGREGDDHKARFVTDAAAYAEMVSYLKALLGEQVVAVAADQDIMGLDEFYGNKLDGK